jgi:hypothetical protein
MNPIVACTLIFSCDDINEDPTLMLLFIGGVLAFLIVADLIFNIVNFFNKDKEK